MKNVLEVMAGTCSSEQLKPSVPMGQVEKTVTIVIHQGSNSMGLHRYLSSLQLEEQPQNPHRWCGKMYFFELFYFISIITFKFSSCAFALPFFHLHGDFVQCGHQSFMSAPSSSVSYIDSGLVRYRGCLGHTRCPGNLCWANDVMDHNECNST